MNRVRLRFSVFSNTYSGSTMKETMQRARGEATKFRHY